MNVLVTGGLGYIGSNIVAELLLAGKSVVVIDNLSNSYISRYDDILRTVSLRSKGNIKSDLKLHVGDVCNSVSLNTVFENFPISSVIHLSGLKSIPDSVNNPLNYYTNNVCSTIELLKCCERFKVNKLVFSSSASVYGNPIYLPIDELHPADPINPYAKSKLISEGIIEDYCKTNDNFNAIVLRYFNPVGTDHCGILGDNPKTPAPNLMPIIADVAQGVRNALIVYDFGESTKDGSGIRDFIHVIDLAYSHLRALELIENLEKNYNRYNVGTGIGHSVFDVVRMFNKLLGTNINTYNLPPRTGEVAVCYADPSLVMSELSWSPKYNLQDMCASVLKFYEGKINNENRES